MGACLIQVVRSHVEIDPIIEISHPEDVVKFGQHVQLLRRGACSHVRGDGTRRVLALCCQCLPSYRGALQRNCHHGLATYESAQPGGTQRSIGWSVISEAKGGPSSTRHRVTCHQARVGWSIFSQASDACPSTKHRLVCNKSSMEWPVISKA